MRAIGRMGLLLLLALGTACEANYHEDLIQQASKLPPQDTLAGGLAPAVSDASGGSVATPAQPNAPATSGGVALTGTPPSQQGGAPGAAGAAAPAQPAAGGRGPARVKK